MSVEMCVTNGTHISTDISNVIVDAFGNEEPKIN